MPWTKNGLEWFTFAQNYTSILVIQLKKPRCKHDLFCTSLVVKSTIKGILYINI